MNGYVLINPGIPGRAVMRHLNCPTCGRRFEETESPSLPFCSERCRLVDLGRWLDERYGMPFESEHDPSEERREGDYAKKLGEGGQRT